MLGIGLIKGMRITMKRFLKKKVTVQYPEVKPKLPPRSHGSFGFDFDKCISCNMCADACPNGVIKVDFVKNDTGKRTLQEYKMNLGYCLFCGLCTKACPTKAIHFETEFDLVCYHRKDTIYKWKKKTHENSQKEAAADISTQIENGQKGMVV